MSDYFDYDAWRERQRVASIRSQISDLQDDVEKYEDARKAVEDAKTSCINEKDAWGETVPRFSGKQVKKSGVFEEEMADALETYVNDAKEENSTAITKAGDLVSKLEVQISKIDTKITELNNRISNLWSQI